jgi:hypothetical protein
VSEPIPSVRADRRAFVARHEVAWELFLEALAAVFVALAFVPAAPDASADLPQAA